MTRQIFLSVAIRMPANSSSRSSCMAILRWTRTFSAGNESSREAAEAAASFVTDPKMVDHTHACLNWDRQSAVVYPNVLTDVQSADVMKLLIAKFQRYVFIVFG